MWDYRHLGLDWASRWTELSTGTPLENSTAAESAARSPARCPRLRRRPSPSSVGLPIRLKLTTRSFNDLRDATLHKAEVKYPISLKFSLMGYLTSALWSVASRKAEV